MEQTRDRVGTIFFKLHTTRVSISTRARLVLAWKTLKEKNSSVLHAIFEKENHHYS